jgi:outer membrane protease
MMSRSRRFPIPSLVFAAALAALAPAPAHAMHATGQPGPGSLQTTTGGFSFSLGTSVGLVEGTASELVYYYPNGRKFKLSELTWDLKDVVMAGLHGSMGIGRRFRLNLGVWSALTEGDGMMVDRDWAYAPGVAAFLEPNDQNWTHESQHPDTSLDKGMIVDTNANIMALQAGPFSFHGILGLKYDTWKWSARGGTYVYSSEGFRDTAGSFPAGAQVITYEQQYLIPYAGLRVSGTWPAFQLESHLLYSPLVSASDSDYHVLRGVLFEGDFSGGTYVGLGLNATWAFARHWSATLGAEYQSISEITGDITISGEEGYGSFGDAAGIAMNAMLFSLGVGYRF